MRSAADWVRRGTIVDNNIVLSSGNYLFYINNQGVPLIAVRGLFGITTTYQGSMVDTDADVVACKPCFDEWVATPPWNDIPPALKVPPTCRHTTTEATPS